MVNGFFWGLSSTKAENLPSSSFISQTYMLHFTSSDPYCSFVCTWTFHIETTFGYACGKSVKIVS
ncbi:MAG TPA: hypothetical protein DCE42_15880 [Myxococcales bacterium]|nr:hypothetical protein [Deltaproteobacteria bacterium]MBU48652.1 hypothetical protein [Deltaproteobacteria bacterium]HAA56243.1 hypothetical protein [Myxococcales bacterium]